VATSKPLVYAERIVRHFALDAHFFELHGCELDGTRISPRTCCPRHAIAPGDAAMIGDRGVDMRAARHHGLHGIGALWGYGTHDELTAAGAHSLCEGPAGLWRSIQSVSARR
jgi:phosphoglycolate phosphatase